MSNLKYKGGFVTNNKPLNFLQGIVNTDIIISLFSKKSQVLYGEKLRAFFAYLSRTYAVDFCNAPSEEIDAEVKKYLNLIRTNPRLLHVALDGLVHIPLYTELAPKLTPTDDIQIFSVVYPDTDVIETSTSENEEGTQSKTVFNVPCFSKENDLWFIANKNATLIYYAPQELCEWDILEESIISRFPYYTDFNGVKITTEKISDVPGEIEDGIAVDQINPARLITNLFGTTSLDFTKFADLFSMQTSKHLRLNDKELCNLPPVMSNPYALPRVTHLNYPFIHLVQTLAASFGQFMKTEHNSLLNKKFTNIDFSTAFKLTNSPLSKIILSIY